MHREEFARHGKRNVAGRITGSENNVREVTRSQESLACSGSRKFICQEGVLTGGGVISQNDKQT